MNFKKKGEALYEGFYDKVRAYSAKQRRIRTYKKLSHAGTLTAEQEAQVKKFWAPYAMPNLAFHRYFTERTGEFHPEYIPLDIFVAYIDPYYNDIRGAKYLDNKCYFDSLFHTIPQPATVLKRVNGIWTNGAYEPVNREQRLALLAEEREGIFVKEAQVSYGGKSVHYVDNPADQPEAVLEIAEQFSTDVLIQRGVKQHPEISRLNAASVNTIRLYSILEKDGSVTICSVIFRIGVGDSRVDNYSSGGVSCGVTEEGILRRYAYNKKGEQLESHPLSGVVFEGYQIPCYDRVVALVKKAHPMLPHYRSVAWDVAVDENGTAVLIEANLCRGGIDPPQLNNGPMYGKHTKRILDEVFGKNK